MGELGGPKPKHHFLTHVASNMRDFGPPKGYWTARFEAKHRVTKGICGSAKNFINIGLTVSTQLQMSLASDLYEGLYNTEPFSLPVKGVKTAEAVPSTDPLKEFVEHGDLVASRIVKNDALLKIGDLVVVQVTNENSITVGRIHSIVVRNNRVLFLCKLFYCERD